MERRPQRRPCKFGKKCNDLRLNKDCGFFHPPSDYPQGARDGGSNANPRYEANRQNPMSHDPAPSNFVPNRMASSSIKNKEVENSIAALLQKDSFTEQDKFSVQVVFESFSVEKFDLDFFYKLTDILAKIVQSNQKAQGEFVLMADRIGLFYSPLLLESFRNSLARSRAFGDQKKTYQVAVAVNHILDFYDLMMKKIPSCSQNFNADHLISFAIYLGTEFPKTFYIVCLSSTERKEREFLEGLIPKAELFKKAKSVLDQKYALAPTAQKTSASPNQATPQTIKYEEPEPTDDFRNMSLYPTKQDFEPFKGILRKNKVNEPFKDVKQYLDIQFRLFREDFYSSLRQGFIDYHDSQMDNTKYLRFSQGKVSEFVVTRNTVGINLVVYIPNRRIRSFNKRFMFGSMLLMSNDKFQNHLVCLIKNFDNKAACETVQNGFINIQVEVISTPNSLDINKIDLFNETFDIVEAKVYFEPYYQVLTKLQALVTVPLADVLVKCEFKKNDSPVYLSEYSGRYDENGRPITSLLKEVASFVNNWTHDAKHTFDKSQAEALQYIFQSKVSLIQGPPGTGKTYVGVHLVRILLHLKQRKLFTGPILIVCFTNHALDQFLEYIMEYTKNITRLGGQTKKEAFQKFTIQAKREEMKSVINRPREFYRLIKNKENFVKGFNDLQNSYEKCFSFPFITSLDIFTESEKWFFDTINEDYRYAYKNAVSQNAKKNNIPKNSKLSFEKYFESRFNGVPEFGLSVLFWLELLNFERLTNEWLQKSSSPELSAEDNKYLDDKEEFDAQQELDKNHEAQKYFEFDKEIKNKASQQTKISFMLSAPIENATKQFIHNIDVFDYYNSQYRHRFPHGQLIYNKVFQANVSLPKEQQQKNQSKQKFVKLTKEEKFVLNNFFLNLKYDHFDQMVDAMNKIKQEANILRNYDDEYSRQLIENDDVIAMTTTGAAKYKDILKNVNSKIVIIEEAAEVLEAHIIASLTSTTEHVVLIGDHMQLRPAVNDMTLSEKYNLDISLFERLINNNMKNIRILVQRRMRPEISGIIKLLYPDLLDDKNVLGRPNIKNLKTNVMFFNHDYKETEASEGESKSNVEEADFICKFSQLLVKIGYKPEQITILSLYSGQLLYIKRKCMADNLLKTIRVATVDNFQGEENDIILLSLVRSNPQNQIGFLKVTNRVNVALSRARLGLYIFGNANCIKNHELKKHKGDLSKSFWLKVFTYLAENKFIDDKITLTCHTHKEELTLKTLSDFNKCPNGGCTKICEARLECGHSCPNFCHEFQVTATDKDGHGTYKCLKKCQRAHRCGHQCSNICSKCDLNNYKCLVLVNYKHPNCRHTSKIQCNISTSNTPIDCLEACNRKFPCGHECNKRCYEDCGQLSKYQKEKGFVAACGQLIEVPLACGHRVNKPCGQPLSSFVKEYKCKERCGKILSDCGHDCKGECYKCFEFRQRERVEDHDRCRHVCNKILICDHACKDTCTPNRYCSPCVEKCQVRCLHSVCPKNCGDPCAGCIEPCIYQCDHLKCTRKCFEVCDRPPCNEKCKQLLPCSHPCLGFCGEKCPPVCKTCNPDDTAFQIFFGFEDEEDARFVELDCGHCFESQGLDKYFESESEKGNLKYKACPFCKRQIRFCMRYQKSIKNMTAAIDRVKYKIIDEGKRLFNEVQLKTENLEEYLMQLKDHKELCNFIRKWLESIQKCKLQVNQIYDLHWSLNRVEPYLQFMISENKSSIMLKLTNLSKHFRDICLEKNPSTINKVILERCLVSLELYSKLWDVINGFDNIKKDHLHLYQQDLQLKSTHETCLKYAEMIEFCDCLTTKAELEKINSFILSSNYQHLIAQKKKLVIQEITKAIGLSSGHWYECPNGHPYVIGECGGAMQQSRCIECNAPIGGAHHQLVGGNRHAGHMDGSSRPAWDPTDQEANMRVIRQLQRDGWG